MKTPRESPQSRRERALERLLERYEAELLSRRRSLRDELRVAPADVRDEMDRSVEHLERAVGVVLLEVSSSAVRGIEKALRRVRSGSYGFCADCGLRIAAARLEALPFAERCRDCQQQVDTAPRQETPRPFSAGL